MKRMTIDEAVRWAYRDELPKSRERPIEARGMGNGSTGPNMLADWWTLPDNAFGVVIDPSKWEDPHPDAIAIHRAVEALDAEPVNYPEDEAGLIDWVGLDLHGLEVRCAAEVFQAVRRRRPAELVHQVAILGLPDMIVDPVELRFMTHANGEVRWFRKEVIVVNGEAIEREVDGRNHKSHRPYPDAYRKPMLEPDPVPSLIGRAKAEVWRSAMDLLFEQLVGRLAEVDLLPCELPELPWEAGRGRILPDLRPRIAFARDKPLHKRKRKLQETP